MLNRFDTAIDVHVRNREWLRAESEAEAEAGAGSEVLGIFVLPGDERELTRVMRERS